MRKGMREGDEGGNEEYGGDMRPEGVRGKEWLGKRGEGRGVRSKGGRVRKEGGGRRVKGGG